MGIFQRIRTLFGREEAQRSSESAPLRADWLVIGLGNPGAEYEATRHNIGAMALDQLLGAASAQLEPYLGGAPAELAIVTVADQQVALVRSTTYMNLSGEAVAPLAQHLHVPLEHIVVLHDELDLPKGRVRVKVGGNENGHNGLKSITQHVGTREYIRVRMGIGRPAAGANIADYVLAPVESDEVTDAEIARAAEAVRVLVEHGVDKAQHIIHSKG